MTDQQQALSGRLESLEKAHALLELRHETHVSKLDEISSTQDKMAESLLRLVVLHESNARFFESIDEMKLELAAVNEKIKTLFECRNWALAGVGLILAAFITAVVTSVMK